MLGWRRTDTVRNFSLADVHIEGTERIVEAVAKYDVDRFIQVSTYNANPDSTCEFFRTKVAMPALILEGRKVLMHPAGYR